MKKLILITIILTTFILASNVIADESFEDFLNDLEETPDYKEGTSYIDDSAAINHFPNLGNLKSIKLEIENNKNEEFSQIETSDRNKLVVDYTSQSLNIKSIYEKRDFGKFFNTGKQPIKQAYILTNNLNKKQEVKFIINHEIYTNEVEWAGKIYQLNEKPIYFKASTAKHRLNDEATELIDHIIYFEDVYYDFKDITNLDYNIYAYSKNNKNYITVKIEQTLKPYEEFLIDPEIGWIQNIIAQDPMIWGPNSGHIADLDNDGDLDLVVTTWNGMNDMVVWYANDGNYPINWTENVITTNVDYPIATDSADLDNDGDIDLVGAILVSDRIEWYENDGNYPANFFVRVIDDNINAVNDVHTSDIDQDGDMDILAAISGEDKFVWYENTGNITNWTQHIISSSSLGAREIQSADIDNDGDLDVVGNSRFENKIVWFENDGNLANINWTERTVASNLHRPLSIHVSDIDNDGDMDIISTIDDEDRIALFRNNGNFASITWTESDISTNALWAVSATTSDMDNDGDLDVVSGSYDDKKIAWHEFNVGTSTWEEHIVQVTSGYGGAYWVGAADLDQDNDTDIVGITGWYTSSVVAWYESNDTQTESVCGPLYENLKLKNNVNSTSTCFDIKNHDLTLDCDGFSITGNGVGDGVHFDGNGGTIIKNCNIQNYKIGTNIKRTRYVSILNSTISNNKVGIFIEVSENDTIVGNTLENNDFVGIYIRPNTQYLNISSNRICNNIRYDIAQVTNNPYNKGSNNICQFPLRWSDFGSPNSCTFTCV